MSKFILRALLFVVISSVVNSCGPSASDNSHPDFSALEQMTQFPKQFDFGGFDDTGFRSATEFCLFYSYDRPTFDDLSSTEKKKLNRRLNNGLVAENEALFAFYESKKGWTFIRFPDGSGNIKGGFGRRCYGRREDESWKNVERNR